MWICVVVDSLQKFGYINFLTSVFNTDIGLAIS